MGKGGWTLAEAIELGQGIERPFRCEQHEDSVASASVNIAKGVWYCYACHASGRVDSKKAPSTDALISMLHPDEAPRVYPDAYLETFTQLAAEPIYWHSRFPAWTTWDLGMGEDPMSGDATFPVHTPAGFLAGVGRRALHPAEDEPRYRYPRHWSASTSLFGFGGKYPPVPVIVVVEGAADRTALHECGIGAVACYGSGLHYPQVELLARHHPKVILLGLDMDEAGERGVTRGFQQLRGMASVGRVRWPKNDPAECTPDERFEAVHVAVRRAGYREGVVPQWSDAISAAQARYQRFVEEAA